MRKHFCLSLILTAFVIVFALPEAARGQFAEGAACAGDLSNRYRIVSNVTYAPTIMSRLYERARISGHFTRDEAERIANGLNSK